MHQMGVTPAEWALTYLRSSRGDTQNVVLAGQSRVWGFELRNMMTLVAIVVAGAGSASMLLWGKPPAYPGQRADRTRACRGARCGGREHRLHLLGREQRVHLELYFVLPLLATVLAATAAISRRVVRPGAILGSGWQWRCCLVAPAP